MKHMYYGLRETSYCRTDNYRFEISRLDSVISHSKNKWRHEKFLKSQIQYVKENKDTFYIGKTYMVIDREAFIIEKTHEYVCEIDDEIELGEHKGAIRRRRYDAINDIMHYYTDIVVERIETEGIDEKIETIRLATIVALEDLYEHYFSEEKEATVEEEPKRKSFWERKSLWDWLFRK